MSLIIIIVLAVIAVGIAWRLMRSLIHALLIGAVIAVIIMVVMPHSVMAHWIHGEAPHVVHVVRSPHTHSVVKNDFQKLKQDIHRFLVHHHLTSPTPVSKSPKTH
jgi:CHASE2 domain-containing sensor protein